MAHDYAMKCIGNPNVSAKTNNEIIAFAWQYADAMQAEADKREVSIAELLKDEISGFFINIETNDVIYSESDIISHDWRRIPDNVDFVALRPIDSKMFFCVASEVDEGKFKVIWKRPTEEWQPDWSQAPAWANYIAVYSDHCNASYFEKEPKIISGYTWGGTDGKSLLTPIPVYAGNWQESLRKRPQ